MIEPYELIHQKGNIEVNNEALGGKGQIYKDCDLGVQISEDGRIWLCIDGIAFVRFKPNRRTKK